MTERFQRLLLLTLWYGAWVAVGVLLARPGLIGMALAFGAGVVVWLLMERFAQGGIDGPHLIGAIIAASVSFGLARVILLVLSAPVT